MTIRPSPRWALIGVGILGLVATACGVAPTAVTSPSEWSFVVRVDTTGTACTGTSVGGNWVLTTTTCPATGVRFLAGQLRGKTFTVDRQRDNSRLRLLHYQGDSAPAAVGFGLPIGVVNLTNGTTLTVASQLACDNDSSDDQSIGSAGLRLLTPDPIDENTVWLQLGSTLTCTQDQGRPILIRSNDHVWYVVGVQNAAMTAIGPSPNISYGPTQNTYDGGQYYAVQARYVSHAAVNWIATVTAS